MDETVETNFGETLVTTVECPECGRPWTGEFRTPVPNRVPCRDCVAKDEAMRKGNRDIHINPRME